jgi:hypothetical protein
MFSPTWTPIRQLRSAAMVDPSDDGVPDVLRLADLEPYLSFTVLRCVVNDCASAFAEFVAFLRESMADPVQAISARILAEISLVAADMIADVGPLGELGFDELYGCTRHVVKATSWISRSAGLVDEVNELLLVLRAGDLIALHGSTPSWDRLRNWVNRGDSPISFVSPEVLVGTFPGDGKTMWLEGVHLPRTTKPETKMYGGSRLQDTLDAMSDGSYALRSVRVDHQPDGNGILRKSLHVSPGKSRLAWRKTPHLQVFLKAAAEALGMIDKTLAAPEEPEPVFEGLATRERNLDKVRKAFDMEVSDPGHLTDEPDAVEEQMARAEILFSVLLDVHGEDNSPVAFVEVENNGQPAGTISVTPVSRGGGEFGADVKIIGPVRQRQVLRKVRDALGDSSAFAIHYGSGHVFRNRHIVRETLTVQPFPGMRFVDFTGFELDREKPVAAKGESLLKLIGCDQDTSLFGWVLKEYGTAWLLCDDGAGEVADFLHLAEDGTLTVLHVKAAETSSEGRRIAVAPYQEVVAQAVKNVRYLNNEALVDRLGSGRIARAVAWHDGVRVPAEDFLEQLAARTASNRTFVTIVQPHVREEVYVRARVAQDRGQPTDDSLSLALLDSLLNTARRAVTARCHDLIVIGSG